MPLVFALVNFWSTAARKMFNVVFRSFMLCINMLQMLYKLGERTCKLTEQEPFELLRPKLSNSLFLLLKENFTSMKISNIPQQRQNWYSLRQIGYRKKNFLRVVFGRCWFQISSGTRTIQIYSNIRENLRKTSTQYFKLGNYSFLSRLSQTTILREKLRLTDKVVIYRVS